MIIVGTRPEIIKMAPIMKEADSRQLPYSVIHTGQHYSPGMSDVFFEQLGLREPDYNLNIGSGTHAEETGGMLIAIERILARTRPSVVLVEGDTNSVLAGGLAARKLNISVGHVEAGLRSRDSTMPEETNRILTDHLSEYLFAPTRTARSNLISEGISARSVWVTGNTIVDSLAECVDLARRVGRLPGGMQDGGYLLLTLHRQENVDAKERLQRILRGLEMVHKKTGLTIVWPIHPRSKRGLGRGHFKPGKGLKLLNPQGYFSFLRLLMGARLVFTDSGGVQEEACILKVPCVTLRDNTERPETLRVGSNVLAGSDPETILEKTMIMLSKERRWRNPFGDGHASARILDVIGDGRRFD
ncbi:MAG: UDP-N-acetylglucosamine 2-epimerase (non-hydrolyzing) [Nitrososphaerales archaeon]